jgi:hypothetical protein
MSTAAMDAATSATPIRGVAVTRADLATPSRMEADRLFGKGSRRPSIDESAPKPD